MRNNIVATRVLPNRQNEKVTGLLKRMRADIVAPDGSFPDVHVDSISNLYTGGSIYLSARGSRKCYLETDLGNVKYYPGRKAHIRYVKQNWNRSKHAKRKKEYRFVIRLAGQRERTG